MCENHWLGSNFILIKVTYGCGKGGYLDNIVECVVVQSHVCLPDFLVQRSQPETWDACVRKHIKRFCSCQRFHRIVDENLRRVTMSASAAATAMSSGSWPSRFFRWWSAWCFNSRQTCNMKLKSKVTLLTPIEELKGPSLQYLVPGVWLPVQCCPAWPPCGGQSYPEHQQHQCGQSSEWGTRRPSRCLIRCSGGLPLCSLHCCSCKGVSKLCRTLSRNYTAILNPRPKQQLGTSQAGCALQQLWNKQS